MASLKLEHIHKSFGKTEVLRDINLEVTPGELFTILGPSGCGKTTLLRIIAGLEHPSQGEIYINDIPQSQLPPFKRPTSLVFQDYALFPHLTVFENIAYGLRKRKINKTLLEKKVHTLLELTHLTPLKLRKPQELSGGERQRVALCRSLAVEPSVLLLDEPLSSLDAAIRYEMRRELKNIQKKIKTTFIYVTHDQEEAMILSDRMAVMSQGNIYQIGTPQSIYNNPRTKLVAEFIGLANLLRMQIVKDEKTMLDLLYENKHFLAAKTLEQSFAPGDWVYLMIRPEKISLSRNGIPEANQLEGTLEEIQYKGKDSLVFIKGKRWNLRATDRGVRFPLQPGGKIIASWKPEDGVVIKDDIKK
jgi:ABC-type Fe3+/spermidine/putrescine transport system ATPase subunit